MAPHPTVRDHRQDVPVADRGRLCGRPFPTDHGLGWVLFRGDEIVETRLPSDHGPDVDEVVDRGPEAVEALVARLLDYFETGEWRPALDLADDAPTAFLRAVYRVVAAIPPGETMTYGEVAEAAGYPGAARAVGTAMARNRYAPLIPCHRVVPAGGGVGHYGGGPKLKETLLRREGAAVVDA